VEYLLFYWSEYYFNQVLRFSTEWSRIASMILTLTMGVCMPLGGWLSDRLLRLAGYRGSRALVAVTGIVACGLLLMAGTVISWGPGAVGRGLIRPGLGRRRHRGGPFLGDRH
jgi:MFS family permease